MATHYSRETNGVLDTQGPGRTRAQNYRSKMKRIRATLVMAGQAIGDTIVLGELPVGAVFAYGVINATATLGTATVSVGTTAAPAAHRAAATFTTPDVPTLFGTAAQSSADPAAATTRLIATIGVAALPAAGTLEIDIYYSDTV